MKVRSSSGKPGAWRSAQTMAPPSSPAFHRSGGGPAEREPGGMAQRTDDGALLLTGLPRQRVGPGRAVLAVGGPALAPLADGLGRDAVTLGQHAGALVRAGDLGADSRRRAGIRMNGE